MDHHWMSGQLRDGELMIHDRYRRRPVGRDLQVWEIALGHTVPAATG
jgi:hypothetical protein